LLTQTYHIGVARQIIDHAGLSHKIRVLEGTLETVLPVIQSEHLPLDFVFIDHIKTAYLSDLKLLMSVPGLLHPGTVVAADNVWFPGAPDYLAYLDSEEGRATWDTVLHPSLLEYQKEKKV
jgi:catechol O-methyltransferase